VKEPYIAEINEKIRHNPTLVELKPNVVPKESDSLHHHFNKHSHSHSHHSQHDFHEMMYQPIKFRPTMEIKGYRPAPAPQLHSSHQAHHLEDYEGPSSYSSSSSEYYNSHEHSPQPHVISYKPAPSPVLLVKKPEIKKVKLITPGLKQFATIKHINRNDYLNYNKNLRPRQEERGEKVIHYRRNPRMLPQYAPDFV
jgi:hypothetical protein